MTNPVQQLIAEIKDNIKHKEFIFAQYSLEELRTSYKLSPEEQKEVEKLELLFFNEDKQNKLQQACWVDKFFIDFFNEWVQELIKDQRFELTAIEKTILDEFFSSEKLHNSHKCFVLENLYLLKINYLAPFANKELKQVIFLSSLKLNELEIYDQRNKLKDLLEKKIQKNPSLINFAIISLNQIYFYCFPHAFNFKLELLATAINDYLVNSLEDQEIDYSDKKYQEVMNFVCFILQSS